MSKSVLHITANAISITATMIAYSSHQGPFVTGARRGAQRSDVCCEGTFLFGGGGEWGVVVASTINHRGIIITTTPTTTITPQGCFAGRAVSSLLPLHQVHTSPGGPTGSAERQGIGPTGSGMRQGAGPTGPTNSGMRQGAGPTGPTNGGMRQGAGPSDSADR